MRSSWLLLVVMSGCDELDPDMFSSRSSSAREIIKIDTAIAETGVVIGDDDDDDTDTGVLPTAETGVVIGDDDDDDTDTDTDTGGNDTGIGDDDDDDDDDDSSDTSDTSDTGESGDTGVSGDDDDDTDGGDDDDDDDDLAPLTYQDKCVAAGLDIPPKFTDWKRVGVVKTPVQGGAKVELWTWSKNKTYCTALPRYDGKGKIDALGMICMDTADGDTCFWDNVDAAGNKVKVDASYDIDAALGGDQLLQNCTSCHRGHNPWVQNNEAPLDGLPQPPNNVWQPVAPQAGWEGWDPATSPRGPSCAKACHEAKNDENNPVLTPGYCVVALDMEKAGLMTRGGGWAAYKKKCDALVGP